MAVNNLNDVTLIPAAELAPGAIGAIRVQVTKALLAKASRELQLPESELVARDIRPQDDLNWGSSTNFSAGAVTTELWDITTAANTGYQTIIDPAVTPYSIMGDQRFVAIYGLRESRYNLSTVLAPSASLIKIQVGNSIKAIWDLEQLSAYRENMVGLCPSAVIIPQNTQYQFFGLITDQGIVTSLQLEGVVVEPRGKVLSP